MTKQFKLGLYIGLPTATIIGLAIPTAVIGAQRIDEAEKVQAEVDALIDTVATDGVVTSTKTFAAFIADWQVEQTKIKAQEAIIETQNEILADKDATTEAKEAAKTAIKAAEDLIEAAKKAQYEALGITFIDNVDYEIIAADAFTSTVTMTAYTEKALKTGKIVSAEIEFIVKFATV